MKIEQNLLFILFSLSFLLYSCEGSGVDNPMKNFDIDTKYLSQNFSNTTNDITIPVITSLPGAEWSVESSAPQWCVVTKNSSANSIRLYVVASEEPDIRNATVTLKSAIKKIEIQVQQLGYGAAIILDKYSSTIDSKGGGLKVITTANVEYTTEITGGWVKPVPSKTKSTRALEQSQSTYTVEPSLLYENRDATITFTCKSDPKVKATYTLTQKGLDVTMEDVTPGKDTKLTIIAGKASEQQQGNEIEKSWDGIYDDKHIYHSRWYERTVFPVTLEYELNGDNQVDYCIYYPRSGDGRFGRLKLYYQTTENPSYTLVKEYDFDEKATPTKINFDTPIINATKFKFEVLSGAKNYVNCAEMEFFTAQTGLNPLEENLLEVFTDVTCSELKQGITDAQIYKLPSLFINIALKLRSNTYDPWEKQFRIHDYKAYSHPGRWAKELRTNSYTTLDNPTGIYAQAGEEVVVLVGNTHKNSVWLHGIENAEENGDVYLLKEGVNKITLLRNSFLYFVYNTDLTFSTPPIRVHIPLNSGKVTGYFDLEEHKTDAAYAELLSKATHKYFCVKGKDMILYFHRNRLIQYQPTTIVDYITLWDHIVNWQLELMGIGDVRPTQFNNHLSAISEDSNGSNYMWASGSQIGFADNALGVFMPYEKMRHGSLTWGPAHEVGHMHQSAITWTGIAESSNNLFSNYVIHKIGVDPSHGMALGELARVRYVEKLPHIYFMGKSNVEHTEIHMRIYWQLYWYFHECKIKPDFYPKLFQKMRSMPQRPNSQIGESQLDFVMAASEVSGLNLTEFFDVWGFLTPADNLPVKQYGEGTCNITQEMIDATKAFMSKYPAPKHPFYYMEDRLKTNPLLEGNLGKEIGDVGYYTQFTNNLKVSSSISYSLSSRSVSIANGAEAVAFELWQNNNRVYFSNFLNFVIPESITTTGLTIKAVQSDGKRIDIPKK